MLFLPKEAVEHRRKIRFDILQLKVLLVEQVMTVVAVPLKAVVFVRMPLPFDNETDRVLEALRRMGQFLTS